MNNYEQTFLNALGEKLWKSINELCLSVDTVNYKHIVLGLMFLKYVSGVFDEHQEKLLQLCKNEEQDNIYYLPRNNYGTNEEYQNAINKKLEILDYSKKKNVIWVPKNARWKYIQQTATLLNSATLTKDSQCGDEKLHSISCFLDNAMYKIEKENPKLKGILHRIGQYQLENKKLAGLITIFSDTSFSQPKYHGQHITSIKVKTIYAQIETITKESQTRTKIIDTLLPKLLCSKISVD